MAKSGAIGRRDFLRLSGAAAAAGWAGGSPLRTAESSRGGAQDMIQEAAAKVGKIPRRKFGPAGREVSVLIGSGDMDAAPAAAAILCGVNYWHKSQQWARGGGAPEAVLKNRDAHYCQVTVDRIGGNHETGLIDEEAHVAFVRDAVKRTGLGYFDDMQLHYGYHNKAELKGQRAFVRAFERLKKEGLVKHLCLSQHGYAGNPRVPRGESAAEVLTAVIEDGLHDNAQFMFSYGDDPAMGAFLELARKTGFGTTAMKTARGIGRMRQDAAFMARLPGGTAPHHALVRWLTTATRLDNAVIRVKNLSELTETYSGAGKALRESDAAAIGMMVARADETACRLCTECQPHCPRQVPIAEILRFERYALDDGTIDAAAELYAGLGRRADACQACGACVAHCPLRLPIPDKLAAVHALLG